MATITSAASGNWSAGATWVGGIAPTNADTVNIGNPVLGTWENTTDIFTAAGHGFADGDAVVCSSSSEQLAPPLDPAVTYYVLYLSSSTFKVALTPGGTPINISSNGGNNRVSSKHVVTLDGTGCVANNVHVYGELACSASANSTLTLEQGMVVYSAGHLNLDTSSDGAVTCSVLLNKSHNATVQQIRAAAPIATEYYGTSAKVTLKGFPRLRYTKLTAGISAGATSCSVTAATGWRTGDTLLLVTTQSYVNGSTAPKHDTVTNVTVSGTSISWTGGITNAHAINGYVVNLTSNCRIAAENSAYKSSFLLANAAVTCTLYIDNAEFNGMWDSAGNAYGFSVSNNGNLTCTVSNTVFYNTPVTWYQATSPYTLTDNIYFMDTPPSSNKKAVMWTNNTQVSNVTETGSFFIGGGTTPTYGLSNAPVGFTFTNLKICGFVAIGNALSVGGTGGNTGTVIGLESWCNYQAIASDYGLWGQLTFKNCEIGTPYSATNKYAWGMLYPMKITIIDSNVDASQSFMSGSTTQMTAWGEIAYVNKGSSVEVQETYTNESMTLPTYSRDTTTRTYGDASLKILGTTYGAVSHDREMTVSVAAGATIRLIGYCQVDANFYNSGTWYAPTIAVLDGATILATGTATSAANGAWEKLDFTATNSAGTARNLTIRLRANRRGSSGYCWFSGIPFGAFVTKVRHYGFLFEETNPLRTTNLAITETVIATAYAYAAATITGSTSAMAIGASTTFAKLYDYSQAWACQNANITYNAPITSYSLGSLVANGNVTISDGAVLNGSGSISMDTFTLSTEFAGGVNYTYTGGTWSQATTIPTFSGGTLTLPTAITTSPGFTMNSGAIVFNATSALWDLSTCTIDSGVTLSNTSGAGITVAMPAGYPTTTIGSGATEIIVTAPAVERGIAFTGLQTGTSIQVFTSGTQTKLFGDNSTAGSTFAFDDATSGSITVDYTIQKAGYFPQRVTGVVLTGAVGGQVDVVVAQVVDRAYVASSGLTYGTTAVVTVGTNPTTNPGTKTFQLTTASTGQNWYSFWIEQWIDKGNATGEDLANVEFPLAPNGPNSFTLGDGWTFSDGATSIAFLTRDGLRYLNTSDVLQKSWAAILTSGVPSGARVRYQQVDGTTESAVVTSGNMDELIQIYDVGVFDYRGYLVLKVQEMGYDQAEANVVTLYGNLEDQLYVVGLAPAVNSVATGNPAVTLTLTRGTYNDVTSGKTFSIKIVSADSGEDIMRELRYNFETGGEFPAASGYDGFDWHDLIQQNGSDFKTVRGNVYGAAATDQGVVVYSSGTTLHPDFTLFTADDGTTYSPPVTADVSITSMSDAGAVPTRLQIINSTALTAASRANTMAYSVGDIRLRQTGIGSENTAGLYLRCTTAGTSAGTPPTWNTTVGGTTTDGTVVWTTYAVLYYDADPAATSLTDTYIDGEEFLAGEVAEIRFAEMNDATSFKTYSTEVAITAAGFSALVAEEADGVYATNALDGSAYETTFSPDFANDYMVLDTNTDFAGKAAYAYYCYTLTTSAGMWGFWGGVTALDEGNYRINTAILNMYFDESAGFVKQTDDVRIFRDDGTRPAIDPTTGGHGIEINWRTPVNTIAVGSAVTSQDKTDIIDGVWSRVLPL